MKGNRRTGSCRKMKSSSQVLSKKEIVEMGFVTSEKCQTGFCREENRRTGLLSQEEIDEMVLSQEEIVKLVLLRIVE